MNIKKMSCKKVAQLFKDDIDWVIQQTQKTSFEHGFDICDDWIGDKPHTERCVGGLCNIKEPENPCKKTIGFVHSHPGNFYPWRVRPFSHFLTPPDMDVAKNLNLQLSCVISMEDRPKMSCARKFDKNSTKESAVYYENITRYSNYLLTTEEMKTAAKRYQKALNACVIELS